MQKRNYDRKKALAYAEKWAFDRNRRYYNFDKIGGDCTNFVSQCIYAGTGIMNYTVNTGWYYRTSYDRTASWSSAKHLYEFIVHNKGTGPYAKEVSRENAEPGDIVQLGNKENGYYHSMLITSVKPEILVTSHTYDVLNKSLSLYSYEFVRYLHIEGARL